VRCDRVAGDEHAIGFEPRCDLPGSVAGSGHDRRVVFPPQARCNALVSLSTATEGVHRAPCESIVACDDAAVLRRLSRGVVGDAVAAGLVGAACSGIPSTAWSLARGDDVLDGARAAGAIVLPHERRTAVLLLAASPVHLALSLGWAAVLAVTLPHRAEPAWGAVAGLGIAALDLSLVGRRISSIRALPQGRQWADHVAFGVAVGLVLQKRRSGGERRTRPT
jgi:hypothetical protein